MTAPRKDRDQIRTRWIARLGRVDSHVTQMYVHRNIWEALGSEIVSENPSTDGQFLDSYTQLYAESVMVAIRRLADSNQETDSLWSLWEAIRRNPEVATRSDYVAIVLAMVDASDVDSVRDQCEQHFTESFGSGEHVDPLRIAEYQNALREDSRRVAAFVDKQIAHLDSSVNRSASQVIDLSEIHEAMDRVAASANHAHRLLDRTHKKYEWVVVPPTWQESLRGLFSNTESAASTLEYKKH